MPYLRPNPKAIKLRVSKQVQRAIRAGHPWVYAESILEQSRPGQPGDLGIVFDERNEFLAAGLYDPHSPIRLRILQARKPATIGPNWFHERLAQATARRQPLAPQGTTGYRLIHGENDGFPGLVLDRYAETLVLKLYTAAWVPYLDELLPLFTALRLPEPNAAEPQKPQRVVIRLSRNLQEQRNALYQLADGQTLYGPPVAGPVIFQENGLRFEADVEHGQKTGFFLDQRENRERVGKLAAGREVLNVFSFSGGFSVYAAQGGCQSVVSLDISQHALDSAERNFRLNADHPAVAAARHECIQGDAFEVLERLGQARRSFDLVVLDPPAFARSQAEKPGALRAYDRLVRLGLKVLRPEGILVAASCSAHVPAEDFFATVHRGAQACGQPLTEIERTGHPLDHPITFPEGQYLKCLLARSRLARSRAPHTGGSNRLRS